MLLYKSRSLGTRELCRSVRECSWLSVLVVVGQTVSEICHIVYKYILRVLLQPSVAVVAMFMYCDPSMWLRSVRRIYLPCTQKYAISCILETRVFCSDDGTRPALEFNVPYLASFSFVLVDVEIMFVCELRDFGATLTPIG